MAMKRQTIWLFTMLSLAVVLSVYYLTGEQASFKQSALQEVEELENIQEEPTEEVFSPTENDMFQSIRLQRQDTRGRLHDEFVSVIGEPETDSEAQVEALDKMEALQELSQKELTLETLLISKGYEDALVMTNDSQVNVYVKTDMLSKEQVAEINQLTFDHLGISSIRVGYHQ
ncbi:SpoIIIAH-like family protein [Paenalkalicoccus suaedae]|uniref:SpoIIIAH-like family protein n=1 Tax=Paenalkalicoccus suaedae TaxID=2592382 RepID=A0A859FDP2_9BACI|nr:SpoIIIAH-like family protein [Paenalkalicoccus suaedae]QKS70958.1 SpoIIIAH-like family protein [Paenalkalicoccus suaedae]